MKPKDTPSTHTTDPDQTTTVVEDEAIRLVHIDFDGNDGDTPTQVIEDTNVLIRSDDAGNDEPFIIDDSTDQQPATEITGGRWPRWATWTALCIVAGAAAGVGGYILSTHSSDTPVQPPAAPDPDQSVMQDVPNAAAKSLPDVAPVMGLPNDDAFGQVLTRAAGATY